MSTKPKGPVTDNAQKTHTDAQGGLHDTAISKSENNKEDTKLTLGDSSQKAGFSYLQAHLDDSLVQTTSKQTVNSNETRKRNFQPGNKDVHIFTAGSSSHACENSVVDSKDARSKFLKKSDVICLGNNCSAIGNTSVNLDYQKDDPVCQEVKSTNLAVNSEELKENENGYSFNSSILKDEKKKRKRRKGKKNNDHNTSTPQEFALPAGTDTSGLMTRATDDNTAGKCMGLRVKQNQSEVIPANSFVVDNANTTEKESVGVDSNIENENGLVQPGSFEEKGTDNVATLLGSCMFDSNKLSSTNVSLIPLQGGRVDANFKTNCLNSTTQEKLCQIAVEEGFTKPSAVVPVKGIHESAYPYIFRYHPQTPGYHPHTPGYHPHTPGYHPHTPGYHPHTPGYHPHTPGYHPHTPGYHPHTPGYHPHTPVYHPHTPGYHLHTPGYHPHTPRYHPHTPGYHPHTPGYHPHTPGCYPHTPWYHPHIPLTVPRPYSSEENQNLESAKHMREAILHPSFISSVTEKFLPYENQKNQLGPINEGANFFQIGNPSSKIGQNVHHGMNIHESGIMRNSDYEFRSYLSPTSTEGNKLQEKEITCLSTDHNVNCISPSSSAQAYNDKLRVAFLPRQSLTWFRKKKLLILDLNGLLADINEDYHNAHMADAKVRGKLVFRRPYCDDFLYFCIRNFELGIWSSRKRQNVDSVVDILMRDLKPYIRFSWDRSKCTITGVKTLENTHKPLVLKELRKLWNKEEPGLPWEEGEFSPSNTLLVDDSPYKALRNPPYSAIFPYPYSYLNWNDNSLGHGGDLRMYLENLAVADDVERFVHNHPFGQPFITQSDPHWDFYAQVAGEGYGSFACRACIHQDPGKETSSSPLTV